MNEPLRSRRSHLSRLEDRKPGRGTRLRLFGLFLLFDVLLLTAVLLSFRTTELVHEQVTLIQTREVYDIQITQQVITHTTVITKVMPYGWVE